MQRVLLLPLVLVVGSADRQLSAVRQEDRLASLQRPSVGHRIGHRIGHRAVRHGDRLASPRLRVGHRAGRLVDPRQSAVRHEDRLASLRLSAGRLVGQPVDRHAAIKTR